MYGLKARILAGLCLAVALVVVAGNPSALLAQKKDKTYGKKPELKKATGQLPADAKLGAVQLAGHIDKLIDAKLKADKVDASALCTDEEFLRRAYLDLAGKIPTAEKAAAFLESKEPNKRAKLIDDLLASEDFGKYQADIWTALLLPRDSDNARLRQWYPNLTTWLEKQFNENPGWDKTVKAFMTATGEVEKNGPVIYWLANNAADKMTDNVTRMFMGVQLQCAQCHNHPFTDYKQNEYWHMAAFFMKVAPNGNPKAAAKNKTTISVGENAKAPNKKRLGPDAKILPPKFLQGESPTVKNSDPLRPLLADWMTKKGNAFFASAMANRMWGHFLGRGLIAPVDDMHDGNPASHPDLLVDLGKQFEANAYDVKYLVRAICNSQTYQRSSKTKGNNGDVGPEHFARMAIKPLAPGQLYDSVVMLVGQGGRQAPKAKGNMPQRGQGGPRQQFIASYGIEDGADPTEYQAGIPQVLRLMNAPQLNNSAILAPLMKTSKTQAETVEKLYLTVLARRPTSEEQQRIGKYLEKKGNSREALGDLLWVLMNTSEFALNR